MIFRDQLDRELHIDQTPVRIISLVPSQTELLVDLGLEDQIVGVTKFCVHPQHLRKNKTIVGGTKDVDYEKIRKLNPDFILCNKEENTPEIVEELEKISRVYVSDVISINDAIEVIRHFGIIFNTRDISASLIQSFLTQLSEFQNLYKEPRRVLYFIWRKPWMVTGKDTFINNLLELNNWENCAIDPNSRYPEIEIEDLTGLKPDLVLLSSEPFPFKEKHITEVREHYKGPIELVDGEYFSWYGSRLIPALEYFRRLQMKLSNSL